MMRRVYSAALILSLAAAPSLADVEIKMVKPGAEQHERNVDEVARASQDQAISKLKGLLKRYRGSRQEPILLSKLAELLQQSGAIHFRIAHGRAHHGKKALDLTSYKGIMKSSISTLNELIGKYPHYEEIDAAYFMRGKGYEELGDWPKASKDYIHLVTHYPAAEQVVPAYMSLAEFAIQAGDHSRAVGFLKKVELRPDTPHYPFALYKLAWAHYNLKNIPTSLSYVQKPVSYYGGKDLGQSDLAFRDNMLQDATLFYLEGYEQKLPQYQVVEALPYFKGLEPGDSLGRMMVRFAKLLRSHGHEADLAAWKDQVLVAESNRPESLEVLLIAYENQFNKRRFAQIVESAQDMVRLHKKHPKLESFQKARKMLLETAENLQAMVVKNKGADGVSKLSASLAAIYDAFTRIVDDSDPRIPGVHYNLAETLFEIKDFEGSTDHYRWVVDHGSWKKGADKGSVADSSLKAIAARYEILRQKQLIPGTLSARKFSDESDKKMEPSLEEWIAWIDTHVSKTGSTIDNFYMEANRALYAQGRIAESVKRMQKFATKNSKSKFAVPAASLALDTAIASSDWERTYELSTDLMDIEGFKATEFSKRLFAVAADAFYKQIEALHKAKEFKSVLSKADDFLEDYSKSKRLADTLTLAGAAAVSLNQKKRAQAYFSRLIAETPQADALGEALIARASIHEDRYDFGSAAKDYRTYLSLPPGQAKSASDDLRRKAIALAWLSGDVAELRTALSSKAICVEKLETECDRYQGLIALESRSGAVEQSYVDKAFDRARKGPEENRAIWAAIALESAKELPFRDRLLMVRQLAGNWDELDPMARFALVPHISVSVPRAFQLNRMSMREVAPLRADERYITRRVEVIREMENAATKVMKMPWSRIRATVLSEVAGLYVDLARGLTELKAPKGLEGAELASYEDTIRKLVLPFEEKGQEIRAKAFEMASHFAIEEDAFKLVADPFFQDNPSQAKALRPAGVKMEKPLALDIAFLDQVDSSGDWDSLDADTDDPAEYLKAHWGQALRAKRWQQIAFFLQEAKEKGLIESGVMGLVKAVSLAAAGAQGEALAEIDEVRKDLPSSVQSKVTSVLIAHYSAAFSRERAQALIEELKNTEPSKAASILTVYPWLSADARTAR